MNFGKFISLSLVIIFLIGIMTGCGATNQGGQTGNSASQGGQVTGGSNNVGENVSVAGVNVSDFTILGKHFRDWNYDALVAYIEESSMGGSSGMFYNICDVSSGEQIGSAYLTGYYEPSQSYQLQLNMHNLVFSFVSPKNESYLSWNVMREGEPGALESDHPVAEILKQPLEAYLDGIFEEGAYQNAVEKKEPVFYGNIYLVVNENGIVTTGNGTETFAFMSDGNGHIQSISYTWNGQGTGNAQSGEQSSTKVEIFDPAKHSVYGLNLYESNLQSLMEFAEQGGLKQFGDIDYVTADYYIDFRSDEMFVSYSEEVQGQRCWYIIPNAEGSGTANVKKGEFAMLGDSIEEFLNWFSPGLYEKASNLTEADFIKDNEVTVNYSIAQFPDGREYQNYTINIDLDYKTEADFGESEYIYDVYVKDGNILGAYIYFMD